MPDVGAAGVGKGKSMNVSNLKKALDWAVAKGMSDLPVVLTVSYDDLSYNADLFSAGRVFRDGEGNCYEENDNDDEEVFNLRGVV